MQQEFSAGGIVYQRPKTKSQRTLWLICQHSQHKGWVFPKGLIGDIVENETIEDTAVREVKEETGIVARIIRKLPKPVQYWHQFKKEKRLKTVHFYLMEAIGGDITDHDHEMMDVKWVTEEEVRNTLTYKNDKGAFEEALTLFNTM